VHNRDLKLNDFDEVESTKDFERNLENFVNFARNLENLVRLCKKSETL